MRIAKIREYHQRPGSLTYIIFLSLFLYEAENTKDKLPLNY